MINATEARSNIAKYENEILANVQAKVEAIVEKMSDTIKFNSENGLDFASFSPYEKSRFTCTQTMECAKQMFQKLFKDAGYTIIENCYTKNSLIIKW